MLKDKVAIITGGTRGIGFAIAKKFLENNAKVVILGSKEETVNKAIAEFKELNKKYEVIGYYPNLTNEEEVSKMFEEVNNKYGQIDILVNNAGISACFRVASFVLANRNARTFSIRLRTAGICLSSAGETFNNHKQY